MLCQLALLARLLFTPQRGERHDAFVKPNVRWAEQVVRKFAVGRRQPFPERLPILHRGSKHAGLFRLTEPLSSQLQHDLVQSRRIDFRIEPGFLIAFYLALLIGLVVAFFFFIPRSPLLFATLHQRRALVKIA
jgi:hypothetical protein